MASSLCSLRFPDSFNFVLLLFSVTSQQSVSEFASGTNLAGLAYNSV